MTIFKIYNNDYGVTINGVNYAFEHVMSCSFENPERRRLRRGANRANKVGIDYLEGTTEASTVTYVILGISKDLHNLLKKCFAEGTRVDCYGIDKKDGSSKIAKNAVVAQDPMQLTLDDSPDSMNMSIVFESFDVSEVHKS